MRLFARLVLALAALGPFAACHAAHAADPPRALSPSIDLEIEDRGPDKSSHVARFSLGVVDGHAGLKSQDGETRYHLTASAGGGGDPTYRLDVKRADSRGAGADIDLNAAIPQHAGPRVVVARIERADGRVTAVTAQVH